MFCDAIIFADKVNTSLCLGGFARVCDPAKALLEVNFKQKKSEAVDAKAILGATVVMPPKIR